jgi:hypothetical protein
MGYGLNYQVCGAIKVLSAGAEDILAAESMKPAAGFIFDHVYFPVPDLSRRSYSFAYFKNT